MFKDADIAAHVRATFGGRGVAQYSQIDAYGQRDASGAGKEGHMARLRRERDARLALTDVAKGAYQTRLRWSK